jgi:hypothetical protein
MAEKHEVISALSSLATVADHTDEGACPEVSVCIAKFYKSLMTPHCVFSLKQCQ